MRSTSRVGGSRERDNPFGQSILTPPTPPQRANPLHSALIPSRMKGLIAFLLFSGTILLIARGKPARAQIGGAEIAFDQHTDGGVFGFDY